MYKFKLFLIFINFCLIFCNSESNKVNSTENYIIKTEKKIPEISNGLTNEDFNNYLINFYKRVEINTIGKEIPDLYVMNLSRDTLNLRNLINSNTIIISSDLHCAWGSDGLTNIFPNTISKFNHNNSNLNIICLIKLLPEDYSNQKKFDNLISKVKGYYKSVLIIDEKDAHQINLYANPTRLYINKEKIVVGMGNGTELGENKLFEEIQAVKYN